MSRIPTHPIPSNEEQCLSAMRGEQLPDNVDGSIERASIIRGIRCSHPFAVSESVTKLCEQEPHFQRARNARLVMSNVIPVSGKEMIDADSTTQPYCIWHPDFATEETYRRLVGVYPSMRYHVGRACAAAGFAGLYSELDLLPDVSIAEEARESGTEGGQAIFDKIMAAPMRYAVMDDFHLSVDAEDPRAPAFLNGDTTVRWLLGVRQAISVIAARPVREVSADIEEDMRLHVDHTHRSDAREHLTRDEVELLYRPLPADLPTVRKDLLIHMAAYDGNVDRYARLSRAAAPMGDVELLCVLRGVYHHTMFARWWAAELDERASPRARNLASGQPAAVRRIRRAIAARRIMINDTQEFERGGGGGGSDAEEPPEDVPPLFWWPARPRDRTLLFLSEHVPPLSQQTSSPPSSSHMTDQQIAAACIACDYEWLYRHLRPTPSPLLRLAAENSPNPFYLEDLRKRAGELGVPIDVGADDGDGAAAVLGGDPEPTQLTLWARLREHHVSQPTTGEGLDRGGPYDGQAAPEGVGEVERHVWASPELLRKVEVFGDGWVDGDTEWLGEKVLPEEKEGGVALVSRERAQEEATG